nr:hypothetical protein [uncultured Caproiciproducens sp.]
MEMKIYNCTNPDIIHLPNSRKSKKAKPVEVEEDPVQKFKNNPDSFFPSIIPPAKPRSK